jgi:phage FluMu gp28-like protein
VRAFCTDVAVARIIAPTLTTAERVERFGEPRLQVIFANMPTEDFQQEYESTFVDEATAYITWEQIKTIEAAHRGPCLFATGVDDAMHAIDELAKLVDDSKVEKQLCAGVDIGRTRNTTEIYVVGVSTLNSLPLRLAITLDNEPFDNQEAVIARVVTALPVIGAYIDRNGIGANLAENLERDHPGKVAGVNFTNASKLLWATDTKMLVEQARAPIPVDRELRLQIHSIKRLKSPSNNVIFDTDRNQKHHADKFWAWSLAQAVYMALARPSRDTVVVDDTSVAISPY